MLGPAIFSILFMLGVVLLIIGLRGRVVNDHPHCMYCGFDLTGRYPESAICSECGRSVRRPECVRFGAREKRRKPLIGGAGLLAAVAIISGGVIWSISQGASVNQYLPTWMLISETSWADDVTVAGALTELTARLSKKNLSPEEIGTIVAKGLARQGDLADSWIPEWGDFIESAHTLGKISKQDMLTYAKQFVIQEFSYRKKVRSGEEWPVSWDRVEVRGGSRQFYDVGSRIMSIERSDDVWNNPYAGGGFDGSTIQTGPGSGGWGTWRTIEFEPDTDEPLTLVIDFAISLTWGATPFGTWQVRYETDAIVVPADEKTVTLTADQSLKEELKTSISISQVSVHDAWASDKKDRLVLQVSYDGPPVNIAFDVLVVVGDEDARLIGYANAAAHENYGQQISKQFVTAFPRDIKTVDIIFRASRKAARRTVDLYDIWDGELIYKDVPIEDRRTKNK